MIQTTNQNGCVKNVQTKRVHRTSGKNTTSTADGDDHMGRAALIRSFPSVSWGSQKLHLALEICVFDVG